MNQQPFNKAHGIVYFPNGKTGNWGTGLDKKVQVTVADDSFLTLEPGFAQCILHVQENGMKALPLTHVDSLMKTINSLQEQLDDLTSNESNSTDLEHSLAEWISRFLNYNDPKQPVAAVLLFKKNTRTSDNAQRITSNHGFAINGQFGTRVYGIDGVSPSYQMVFLVFTKEDRSTAQAIPISNSILLQGAIKDLTRQLNQAKVHHAQQAKKEAEAVSQTANIAKTVRQTVHKMRASNAFG